LSGFSVASATFLTGFFERSGSNSLVTVIGMYLIAFLIFVSTAMIFATVPTIAANEQDESVVRWQRALCMLGDCGYYLGLSLAWLAMRPFLLAIRLEFLADIFTWLLLIAALAGASRLSLWLYRLTDHSGLACASMPVVGIGGAALYRFVLAPAYPALWPAEHAALLFAVVGFLIFGIGFAADTLMLAGGPQSRAARLFSGNRSACLLIFMQMAITASGLSWAAVAG
jgi:hypothetical protein